MYYGVWSDGCWEDVCFSLTLLTNRYQHSAILRYTMEALEHLIANDLFPSAVLEGKRHAGGDTNLKPEDVFEFHVTFLELLGKTARDLVGVKHADEEGSEEEVFKPVNIIEDKVNTSMFHDINSKL